MTAPEHGPAPGTGDERHRLPAVDELLEASHLAAPHELPALVRRAARRLGCRDAAAHLADLQQHVLVPFLPRAALPDPGVPVEPLDIDTTLAGRVFQQLEAQVQDLDDGGARLWVPVLDGTQRLGVLAADHDDRAALDADGGLRPALDRLAAVVAQLVETKSSYGDELVTVRRRAAMGLAAEVQWSLLPPLTTATTEVVVAAALEPAYRVAGDTVDYAVNPGRVHIAVFDGMGHGLQAAQLATLSVSAYRNGRRGGQTLAETARSVDSVLAAAFSSEAFTTAVLAELDTATGGLRWVNAGHPEPLLLRDGKVVKALLADPEPPLGLGLALAHAGTPVVGEEQLQPGDRVLLYTDGVVEARSPEGEFFGLQRFTDLVLRNAAAGLPAAETMRRTVRALLEHQRGQLSDDASMLLLEWHGAAGPAAG